MAQRLVSSPSYWGLQKNGLIESAWKISSELCSCEESQKESCQKRHKMAAKASICPVVVDHLPRFSSDQSLTDPMCLCSSSMIAMRHLSHFIAVSIRRRILLLSGDSCQRSLDRAHKDPNRTFIFISGACQSPCTRPQSYSLRE